MEVSSSHNTDTTYYTNLLLLQLKRRNLNSTATFNTPGTLKKFKQKGTKITINNPIAFHHSPSVIPNFKAPFMQALGRDSADTIDPK